jgi:hypothetical protein
MKVYIGPYRSWFGPYQLANLLRHVGVSEDRCDAIGDWLNETWVKGFCEWVESKKKRKIKITIHKYDTWSMDSTLSMIIAPMLRQLKETKHGSPYVDDEDVPEHLRSSSALPKENEWDTDSNFHARWEWVMDEMIWAFNEEEKEHRFGEDVEGSFFKSNGKLLDKEAYNAYHARKQNGFRLFGKYYQALWD